MNRCSTFSGIESNGNSLSSNTISSTFPLPSWKTKTTTTIQEGNERAVRRTTKSKPDRVYLPSKELFRNYYAMLEPLGKGSFGSVYIAVRKEKFYAVKIMRKAEQPMYNSEIEMMQKVSSETIKSCINLVHVFESPTTIFLVMDLLLGGDLFEYVVTHNVSGKTLTFRHALIFAKKMMMAVEACHLQDFSHLDIKLENFVFRDKVTSRNIETVDLVLVDFGAAQPYLVKSFAKDSDSYKKDMDDLWRGGEETLITGTMSYIAPECLIKRRFSSRSDVWSVGVSLYMMLTGERPFESADEAGMESLILKEATNHKSKSIFKTSPVLMEINTPSEISRLLERLTDAEPENRPSSSEAVKLIEQVISTVTS